jgi:hypothetical protein
VLFELLLMIVAEHTAEMPRRGLERLQGEFDSPEIPLASSFFMWRGRSDSRNPKKLIIYTTVTPDCCVFPSIATRSLRARAVAQNRIILILLEILQTIHFTPCWFEFSSRRTELHKA